MATSSTHLPEGKEHITDHWYTDVPSVLGAKIYSYPAHCTGLELFPELPQNKICYILHSKYTSFYCFPIISTSAIWNSLF